ncbi:MAG: DUF4168 domain-containing protein [Chitinispirillales bacterium]|nr:DUF4168 domain-containing protein [Chitinispirillales bacterium]
MSAFKKKFRLSAFITGSLIVLMVVLSVTGSIPGLGAPSVDKISEEDIASFVQVNHRMTAIQSELEGRMVKAIEEKGLTVEQYVEITLSQQNPELASAVTEQELEKIGIINEKIEGLNNELQAKSLEVLAEAGLTVQRYGEIANAVENSTSAQKQYNELMEELHGHSSEEALG